MSTPHKHTVFISSTYDDLKEVRQQIVFACLEAGHIPLGMESFPASSDGAWEVIQRAIDSADYYVVVVATKYGSLVPNGNGISYTEREFDYAAEKKLPILGFILDPEADWKPKHEEVNPVSRQRLLEFKEKIKSRTVRFWKTKEDLHGQFAISLQWAISTHPRPGWVPSTEAASPQLAEEMARLIRERDYLKRQHDFERSLDRIGHVLASVQARAGPQGTTLLDTLLQFGQALPINNGVVQTNAILTAGDNDEQTRDYEMLASRSVLHEIRDNVPDKSLRYFALTRGAVELIRLWDPRRILSHLEENHQAVDWQYFAAKPGPDSCVSSVILEHKVSTHESNEIEKTAWQCASMQSDFGE